MSSIDDLLSTTIAIINTMNTTADKIYKHSCTTKEIQDSINGIVLSIQNTSYATNNTILTKLLAHDSITSYLSKEHSSLVELNNTTNSKTSYLAAFHSKLYAALREE